MKLSAQLNNFDKVCEILNRLDGLMLYVTWWLIKIVQMRAGLAR